MSNMKFDYSQKMQQQLRLSPQMIQAVEILRLPVEELCDRVYQEAEKNPAIEIIKDADLSIRSLPSTIHTKNSNASDSYQAFLENAADHEESLQENLLFQLSMLDISEEERNLGERIIQNLDAHGFFTTAPDSLLYPHETIEFLDKTLGIIRSLEPKGIAFSSVQDSLLFQSELRGNCSPLVSEILKNHFAVLEKKRLPLIKKYLQDEGLVCTIEELEEALQCIRSLEPYPAGQFNTVDSKVQYVVPDVIIKKRDENESGEVDGEIQEFTIEFLKGSLPEITVSPVYMKLIEEKGKSKEEYQFASDAIQNARQFIQALSFRSTSIFHAIQVIVMRQYDFFCNGPGHLVPLRQKDVAEEIGMHEATISRIANGKYVQCDWGLFELKYFFSNAVNEHNGSQVQDSKESIQHQIQMLLQENENIGGKKLSDSKLVQLLEKKGIIIARRTVAKYRNELNIESSFDRL